MILTAHQGSYLGWLGLFDKIAQADEFVIYDCVPMDTSSSTSFENRNKILTNTGPLWLTVPIRRSHGAPLSEIRIVDDSSWQKKHWRSIEQAYHKAPFWSHYAADLEPFYMATKWRALVDVDEVMLRWLMNAIGLQRPIRRATAIGDLVGSKSERIISMCKAMGATTYIFGKLGRDYADLSAFEEAGIEVRFQDYQHPTYPQAQGDRPFESHLSVLDLIMNVGPEDSLAVLRNAAA